MQSFSSILKKAKFALKNAGITDCDTDAWLLFEYVFNMSRSEFVLKSYENADDGKVLEFDTLVGKRKNGIPVQYLTHQAWFYGRSFFVNEGVLIPRFDTEILVEEALKYLETGMEVLDLCTGSGCVILSLICEKGVCGTGSDISDTALSIAKKNRDLLGVNCTFVKSDVFTGINGKYDMIVANPPYIRSDVIETLSEEVKSYEPRIALDGGEDGLHFYRQIIKDAKKHLLSGAWLMFEIGFDQGVLVKTLMEDAGFADTNIVKDLASNDRVVKGRYV